MRARSAVKLSRAAPRRVMAAAASGRARDANLLALVTLSVGACADTPPLPDARSVPISTPRTQDPVSNAVISRRAGTITLEEPDSALITGQRSRAARTEPASTAGVRLVLDELRSVPLPLGTEPSGFALSTRGSVLLLQAGPAKPMVVSPEGEVQLLSEYPFRRPIGASFVDEWVVQIFDSEVPAIVTMSVTDSLRSIRRLALPVAPLAAVRGSGGWLVSGKTPGDEALLLEVPHDSTLPASLLQVPELLDSPFASKPFHLRMQGSRVLLTLLNPPYTTIQPPLDGPRGLTLDPLAETGHRPLLPAAPSIVALSPIILDRGDTASIQ